MDEKFKSMFVELHYFVEQTTDTSSLRVLAKIAMLLQDTVQELHDKELNPGIEIAKWANLKSEGVLMADGYGEGIKQDFPEVFTED